MKKVILYLVSALLVTGCSQSNSESIDLIEKCDSITGGSYNLKFVTNSNQILEDVNVCIACGSDAYSELPILTSENNTFDGWYYDLELRQKVIATSTLDIAPVPIYSKKDSSCIVGYKDITLYAKWN